MSKIASLLSLTTKSKHIRTPENRSGINTCEHKQKTQITTNTANMLKMRTEKAHSDDLACSHLTVTLKVCEVSSTVRSEVEKKIS